MIRNLWPRTRGAWAVVAFAVVTFFALDVLALMGSELAAELLLSLAGMVGGIAVGYAVAHPLKARLGGSGMGRLAGIFFGLAAVFVIIFGGSALAGIPAFPTAEGGNAGILIYGSAFGFGTSFLNGLGPSRAPEEPPVVDGRPELKAAAVVLGTAAGLFAAFFSLYVLVEYVAAPLIRYFAG